jgi:single-strand DNA-binding protein
MGKGINKVMLLGHLGKDPEVRVLQSGISVANVSIATTEKRKIDGEWQDQTEWTRLVFWDKLAEIATQYLQKGSKIFIEGKLKTRSYEQNGETKYITEVHVNELVMLDSGSESGMRKSESGVRNAELGIGEEKKFGGGKSELGIGEEKTNNQQPTTDNRSPQTEEGWHELYGGKKEIEKPAVGDDDDIPF